MNSIPFFKYQGTGNDFVIIDGFKHALDFADQPELVSKICSRRFGIGADGLIIVKSHPTFDFEMLYFNADGALGSMCGNGSRCAVHFAYTKGYISEECKFMAYDGAHDANFKSEERIEIKMRPVSAWQDIDDALVLDTGSPHYVTYTDKVNELDVKSKGAQIRNSPPFIEKGINVNFVETTGRGLQVRTFERGVEDETLSCGTGVTACAIAEYLKRNLQGDEELEISTMGGTLYVRLSRTGNTMDDIWLCGPAQMVFEGMIAS